MRVFSFSVLRVFRPSSHIPALIMKAGVDQVRDSDRHFSHHLSVYMSSSSIGMADVARLPPVTAAVASSLSGNPLNQLSRLQLQQLANAVYAGRSPSALPAGIKDVHQAMELAESRAISGVHREYAFDCLAHVHNHLMSLARGGRGGDGYTS